MLMGLINQLITGGSPFKMIRCPLVQGQSMIKGLLPREEGNDSHKKGGSVYIFERLEDFTVKNGDFLPSKTNIYHGDNGRIYIGTAWWFRTCLYFPSHWEYHYPNWRTHIFSEGLKSPTRKSLSRNFHPPMYLAVGDPESKQWKLFDMSA